ncbi:acyl-CoA dehydrogenase family protein [Streptomyces sp. NPDC018711]|uniref:acyl-CoA dehydrogenase family protein n=1 Tax=Streptomyces sp. NPDC018711 TaxID=3365052 RepID=UPI0037B7FD59
MTIVDAPAPALAFLGTGPLQAIAARRAEEAERTGRLHAEVVGALTAAGLARHFVPRRWGGTAGSFTELLGTVAAVGSACASTGWCAALYAAHGRLAAHLPTEGQRDLWGDSPDVRIAAAVVPPAGWLAPAPGGWTLSGEWGFASGVHDADWVLLASLDHSGDGAPGYRVLAVPREQVRVRETWDAVGLRATGSHSVTAEAVFVPEHRTFLREALVTGVADADAAPCHRVPYQLVAALLFAAPALGAARGALDAWTLLAGLRRLPDGRPHTDDPAVQQTLARCSAEIDAARLLLESAAHRADGLAGTAPEQRDVVGAAALNQRDATVAVDLLVGAVERLMRTAGARGLVRGGGLERAWRDIHAIAAHAALQPAPAAAAYAATVFPSAS